MPRIDAFSPAHLPQLLQLVNLHLTAAIPGWALSETTLARHLEHDDTQPITDPWVAERTTLCAVEGYRILAAAHLLRYGDPLRSAVWRLAHDRRAARVQPGLRPYDPTEGGDV